MTAMQSMGSSERSRRSAYLAAPSPVSTAPRPEDPPVTPAVTLHAARDRTGARSFFALLSFLAIAFGVAALGSLISAPAIDGWYADTPKPMWNPPNAVFGPIWTVLYTVMSLAAWLVWRRPDSLARTRALRAYVVQLALNAAWSPAFFGLGALVGAPGVWVALGIIVVLDFAILATIIRFGDVSKVASSMLIPYWFWALFATTLNAAIAVLAR